MKTNSSSTKARCSRCGKRFKKGGLKYRINLEIVSDFDGYIEDLSKKPDDYLNLRVKEIIQNTENISEEELEKLVYLKREVLVCAECRKELLRTLKRFFQKG